MRFVFIAFQKFGILRILDAQNKIHVVDNIALTYTYTEKNIKSYTARKLYTYVTLVTLSRYILQTKI